MAYVGDGSVECMSDGCTVTAATEVVAEAAGWDVVEEQPYCPLHKYQAARQALAAAEFARLRASAETRKVKLNAHKARQWLSAEEYRAWDEFQSDMANFHQNHGKLAPAVLRTLDPARWRDQYRKTGRIDVELVADALFENEKRASGTREWIMGRVE